MAFSTRAPIAQLGVIAAAALLAAGAAAPLRAEATVQQARSSASADANADRRICVRMELPNSRLPRRVCRTQAEWDRLGGLPTED